MREINQLKPFHELWESRGFVAWRQTVEGELKFLEGLAWGAGGPQPSSMETAALMEMGLANPTTREERLEAFQACRAVVNYINQKLGWLRKQAERYEQLMREETPSKVAQEG